MELKNILSKFKTVEPKKEKTFYALEISYESLKAAVWTVREERAVVLQMGSVEEWDEREKDSLNSAAQKSLSKAAEGMQSPPKEIIFGLPQNWVEGTAVVNDKKIFLQEITTAESLQAVGFVVTIEALIEYLKIKEGIPPNAIFINLEESQISVFLTELGQIKGFEKVVRSGDLASDVREALARFGEVKNFPARMLLFDGIADFEEAKQQLMSFSWEEELPFLHVPKIQTLGGSIGLKAVAVAGGSEVAKSLGFPITVKKEEETFKEDTQTASSSNQAEEPRKKEVETETPKNSTEILSAEEAGFVEDKDILEEETQSPSPSEEIDAKISKQIKEEKKKRLTPQKTFEKKQNYFSKFKKIPTQIVSRLKKILGKKVAVLLLLIFLILAVVIGAGAYFYWNVPKAEINIFVSAKILEKEMDFSLSTDSQAETDLIKAERLEKEVEAQAEKETTGNKLIGEKAKGEVTVFNKTDVKKTFEAGTALIGKDNLKYVLDEEVTIASKSSEIIDGGEKITYGKTKTKITAGAIGSDYNTAKDTEFKIQEYSSSQFSAEAETEISGGVSREVAAVGEEDIQSSREGLKAELLEKAKKELRESISSDQEIILTEEQEVIKEELSAEAGEEAEQVSLTLGLKVYAYSYNREMLENELKKELFQLVPRGYTLESEKINIKVKDTTVENEKVNLKINAEAQLLPKVNKDELKQKLAGKSPKVAEGYLNTIPNFIQAEVEIKPRLPERIEIIPHRTDNININVETR